MRSFLTYPVIHPRVTDARPTPAPSLCTSDLVDDIRAMREILGCRHRNRNRLSSQVERCWDCGRERGHGFWPLSRIWRRRVTPAVAGSVRPRRAAEVR